jgi:hypothetical protein
MISPAERSLQAAAVSLAAVLFLLTLECYSPPIIPLPQVDNMNIKISLLVESVVPNQPQQ